METDYDDTLDALREEVRAEVRQQVKAEMAAAARPTSPADEDPAFRESVLNAKNGEELERLILEANATHEGSR